ncbi:YkgJ family cysteine cluster protein [Natronorubrum sp. JWXQ-INN-674]|uniref:YkgJ family cysteine cluster protein n=1 Tax=Natronorubrum halalkaliphilum TaxID=2691917 RepID=A0A6B0VMZ0_9EURY|nr:YkgJ family cysteine cluster protein [Natronorubrum halalkaliphilum]MXV62904.1 YkgJ family cysteine cluster protein [Natronorubrum halalkaliphilum]
MEVHCEGCAGCCMDWRSLLETESDGTAHRRRHTSVDTAAGTARAPLDDDANFVPLTRDEVRAFLESGMAPALTPRFWHARDADEGVAVDGYTVAAVAGRPVFFVGLRKPPKPVAPFGRAEPTWLPTCVFLDPATLQCRIHGDDRFPDECGVYPEHNLRLEQETECERVESAFGGERLLESGTDDDLDGLLLGLQALGAKLFAHPRPKALEGIVDRAASGRLTAEDRAECLAVAAASSPGTLATSDHHYEQGKARALEAAVGEYETVEGGGDDGRGGDGEPDDGRDADDADSEGSWVGPAIREWYRRRDAAETVPPTTIASNVEADRGAPETPGWDVLE